eukprot:CAMPEP_0198425340 /NCGR_PEP_ID=MMETSP1452-20131203/4495_1 /TAXON_ID=1181717 /ORGANISM="Synchroma pusillum, Strain CCMP3072" /LENGTH=402 /DNA_ID=CAMNT_0044145695 /DNA_START=17 /DNA_END=1225 /DNA_ORIENTATION=+
MAGLRIAAGLALLACTSAFRAAGRSAVRPSALRMALIPGQPYGTQKSLEKLDEMIKTANTIAKTGRGIAATDESNATTGKRLATIGVENTEENRRDWRELLYTAPGLGEYVSGAIMFEETLYQRARNGKQFVDLLNEAGIIPGIKVDTGMQPLNPFGETATQGLDMLGARCEKYYEQGARFCKWRAVVQCTHDLPSEQAMVENAHGLARYAAIAQSAGLVPIVEPETTLGPGDHSIERVAEVSEKFNSLVFRFLNEYDVVLEAILLKPNMVLPGLDLGVPPPEEVAKYTVQVMKRTVPAAVPGIHFLSGGMSEEESTLNLQALNDEYPTAPWSLTFSYGRALQSTTLKTWAGKEENWDAAQDIMVQLAKVHAQACRGEYTGPHPVPGGGRILQPIRLGGAGK